MRTLLFFICLLPLVSFAQQDTTFIEQYCQVKIETIAFTDKMSIDIDSGEEKRTFADTRLRNADGKLRRFNNVTDALNYMGRQGWILMNVYPPNLSGNTTTWYLFKKLIKGPKL